jgi:hypothetical protein
MFKATRKGKWWGWNTETVVKSILSRAKEPDTILRAMGNQDIVSAGVTSSHLCSNHIDKARCSGSQL